MNTYEIELNSGRAATDAPDLEEVEADTVQIDNGALIFRVGGIRPDDAGSFFIVTFGEPVASYSNGSWKRFRIVS